MAAKTAKTPPPATDGKYHANQEDTDGSPFHIQEERSVAKLVKKLTRAKKKGEAKPPPEHPVKLWKQKVIQRLRDTGQLAPEGSK